SLFPFLPFPRSSFFFFNTPAPSEIYTLSLHDALPISHRAARLALDVRASRDPAGRRLRRRRRIAIRLEPACAVVSAAASNWLDRDRKSTRLNSSHRTISYAVFCLKKKKKKSDNTYKTT